MNAHLTEILAKAANERMWDSGLFARSDAESMLNGEIDTNYSRMDLVLVYQELETAREHFMVSRSRESRLVRAELDVDGGIRRPAVLTELYSLEEIQQLEAGSSPLLLYVFSGGLTRRSQDITDRDRVEGAMTVDHTIANNKVSAFLQTNRAIDHGMRTLLRTLRPEAGVTSGVAFLPSNNSGICAWLNNTDYLPKP